MGSVEAIVKGTEFPLWFSMVLSLLGVGALYLILLQRINLPAAYPLVGLLMGSFPAHLLDRLLRKNGNSDA